MSEYKNRCIYFYWQTAGDFKWPNSAEGDLLKIGLKEIEKLTKERDRLEVMATKWVDRSHHDWDELQRIYNSGKP